MVIIEDLHWGTGPLVEVLERRGLSGARGPGAPARDDAPRRGRVPGGGDADAGALADGQVAELAESALAGRCRLACAGAGRRPRGREPVLRRGGARGSARQSSRAQRRRWSLRAGGGRSRQPRHRPRRPRRPHRPAAARGEGGAAGRLGDRTSSPGGPGTDRLERRGAHARGARLRPPHTGEAKASRVRLQARAHPRGRLRRPAKGGRAPLTPPSHAGSGGRRGQRTRRVLRRLPSTTTKQSVEPDDADLAWPGADGRVVRTPGARRRVVAPGGTARRRTIRDRRRRWPSCTSAVAHESEPDRQAELWEEIGHANALRFDGEAFRAAMEKAIELAGPSGELYTELALQTVATIRNVEPAAGRGVRRRLDRQGTRAVGRRLADPCEGPRRGCGLSEETRLPLGQLHALALTQSVTSISVRTRLQL